MIGNRYFPPYESSEHDDMGRLIALCVLLLTTASNLEVVVGMLRDGRVHHEDAATALVHAESGPGEHGHEDASAPANHRHGKGHEHGTSGDHCTHVHGVALVGSFSFLLLGGEAGVEYADAPLPDPLISEALVHPPRV